MTLKDALAKIAEADAGKITARLADLALQSALTARGVDNLYLEHRLDQEAWKLLIAELLTAKDSRSDLAAAISKVLRGWILKGPEVALVVSGTMIYGRAISLDRFCALLIKQGHFASVKTARRRLRRLLSETLTQMVTDCTRFKLGQYLMWGTFSSANPASDPFAGMPPSADAVRALLGLERNEKGQPLLLMQYTLPEGVAGRFPTVAEAYAGEGWSYFFRPSPTGSSSGLTLPWPEYQDENPRPEVVHDVIGGEQLAARLRMLL